MEAGAHGVYDNTDLQVKPSSEDESEWVDETSAEGPTKPEEYTEAQPRPAVDIVNVQLDPTATEGSTEAVTTSMPSEAAPTIATDPPIDPQFDATQGPVMPDVLIGCDGGNFVRMDGAKKGQIAYIYKVMECSRDGKIDERYTTNADECLGECDRTENCTHVNIEKYPNKDNNYLCKLFNGPRAEYDESWRCVQRPIPNPESVERDSEIACYVKPSPQQMEAVVKMLNLKEVPVYSIYTEPQSLHWGQLIGLGGAGFVVAVLTTVRAMKLW